jgi:hypothetical protein
VLSGLALAAADFLAPWSLTVTLADAPTQMVTGGVLDANALLDFELILSFSADVLGAVQPAI